MPAKKLDKNVLDQLQRAIEADAFPELESLIGSGVSLNQKLDIPPRRLTLLEFAVEKNAVKSVGFLIRAGADLNKGSHKPLIHAALHNRLEIVQMLLEAGANPDVTGLSDDDERGLTALIYATDLPDKFEVLKLLLKHGANPHLATNKGNTALTYAVEYGNLAAAELLLSVGCKPSGQLLHGLIARCSRDSLKLFKLLVAAGADISLSKPGTFPQRTASDLAGDCLRDKLSLIHEVEKRERKDWEQQTLERWKSEAQIYQEMIDVVAQARTAKRSFPGQGQEVVIRRRR